MNELIMTNYISSFREGEVSLIGPLSLKVIPKLCGLPGLLMMVFTEYFFFQECLAPPWEGDVMLREGSQG